MRNYWLEFFVGVFIVAAVCGLFFLAFKVSGLTQMNGGNYYTVTADFDNIGDLKVRAPVAMAGVTVGRVAQINLNPQSYRADVVLQISDKYKDLPVDTSASIFTQGLLGSNYISLSPGFEEKTLQPGSRIQTTHSAIILENLIGQLMFSLTNNKDDKSDASKKQQGSEVNTQQTVNG